MTYLQLMNRILRRLREDEVTAVDETDYSSLLGDIINEAKKEVENAWNWNVLRDTVQLVTVADTFRYALTGAGNEFRVLQVFDDTNDRHLHQKNQAQMTLLFNANPSTSDQPYYYNFNGADSNADPYVDLYPIPDSVYTINFDMVIPQADLSAGSDVLLVPWLPVFWEALANALDERGEDGSAAYSRASARAESTLGSAIAQDIERHPEEMMLQTDVYDTRTNWAQ